jgi:hypothetical protein
MRPTDENEMEMDMGRLLRELAAETEPARLPTAGQVWWKAEILLRLEERQEAGERAARPAIWGQAAGLLTAGIGLTFGSSLLTAGPSIVLTASLVPVGVLLALGLLARES